MRVTIDDAHIVAKQLREKNPTIQGIELFGSVARNRYGHDLDFIILVSDEIARVWWSDMRDIHVKWPPQILFVRRIVKKLFPALDEAFIWKQKERRQSRVSDLIGLDLALFQKQYRPGTIIDAWLFPLDWRTGKNLNKNAMFKIADISNDRKTLAFLKSIASLAVTIA